MSILIRLLPWGILLWLICCFFYSMGRKSAVKGQKKAKNPHRKVVESTVLEEQSQNDNDDDKKNQ